MPEVGKKAWIEVTMTPKPDGTGTDMSVQTDLTSEDELVVALLLTAENITGVSTDGYIRLVEEVRRAAAREEAMRGV